MSAVYEYSLVDLRVPAARIPAPDPVEHWARGILAESEIPVVASARHVFPSPVPGAHAYTLVLVLAASHLVVHTAPESDWVHVTFALCGSDIRAGLEAAAIRFFAPSRYRLAHARGSAPE